MSQPVTHDQESGVAMTRRLFTVCGASAGDKAKVSQSKQTTAHRPLQFAIITLSLLLGTFLIALDETILSTAIPSVTSHFHSLDDIAWYSAGYIVTLTALQPTFGKLYRLLNIKIVYLTGIVIFEVGSIICAAAPSSTVFILGRAVAGCGGAGILQGALAIITNTVPLEKRALYNSIILSSFVICVCAGPLLGGAFTQHLTWRWCFWINVPLGGLVFFLILVFLRLQTNATQRRFRSMPATEKVKRLDPVGAVLVVSMTVCLLLALHWAGISMPWKSATVIGLLIGTGLLAAAFVYSQWKLGRDAMIPLSVLKQRSILAGALFFFFYAMPTYIYAYYIPIYFQSVKGTTPIRSAVNYLAVGVPQIAFVVISGALTTQFGLYVPYMIVGSGISAVGTGFILNIDIDTPRAYWAGMFVLYATGTGLAINVPYTAVQAVLEEEDVPTGNAILLFFFQLGAAVSLSISQTIFVNSLQANVRSGLPSLRPEDVMHAGAYNLGSLTDDPAVLRRLRSIYASSLNTLFILPLAMICLTFAISLAFEHKNIKGVAEERKARNAENLAGSPTPAERNRGSGDCSREQ